MRHVRLIAATVAALLCVAAFAESSRESPEPPDSTRAAFDLLGQPVHATRILPIPVLEGHVYAVPTLLEGLEDEEARVRARCCFLLGQIADQSVCDALAGMLDDPDRRVREFAGMALARMGDRRGRHAAAAALVGNRWWVRCWAVEAAGRLGAEQAVVRALDDPDPLVREIAENALAADWEPARAEARYSGPSDATLDDVTLSFVNYLIGETDWWWHAGHYPQILRTIETALWLDPTWAEGYGLAGHLYWSLGRDTEAIAVHRRGVQALPESWDTNWELGFYYFNALQRYEKAAEFLGRARELGCPPKLAHMHAHALEKAGHPEQALAVWRELLEEGPEDGSVPFNIERLERELGRG